MTSAALVAAHGKDTTVHERFIMYNLVIHERVTGDHIADWHTDVIEFNGIDVNVFIDTDTDNIASYLAYVATRTDLVQTREQRNIGDTVVIIHTWRTKS